MIGFFCNKTMIGVCFYMPQMTISKTSENALKFTLTAPFAHALTHMNNISPYMVNTETGLLRVIEVRIL
jgi:hypothetical protein